MAYLFRSRTTLEAAASREAMDVCERVIEEMGAELHDDLIQRLSVFRLYIDRLDRSKSDPSETESIIINMNADFKEIVQSIRRISGRLLPTKQTDDSFQTTISMLCQNMERPGGGTIHFEPFGAEQPIPEADTAYLFRIIQELVHNAIKHSSAWHVWVRFYWTNNQLFIEVEDDGTGFSRILEFVGSLSSKNNTLRMRTKTIGAEIQYLSGKKGLLAKVIYKFQRAT
jgi:signal transduction histidine kinase